MDGGLQQHRRLTLWSQAATPAHSDFEWAPYGIGGSSRQASDDKQPECTVRTSALLLPF